MSIRNDTWASVSYTICAKSNIFLDYISLRIDETTGLPFVSKKYPNEYKELERIREGDVVFCLNDVYFSNTIETDQQKVLLSSLLETTKRFSLRLLDLKEFIEKGVPRIEQVILPDLKVNLRIGTFSSSLSACIVSISSKEFSSIVGSALLAINDEVVVNKTAESILLLLEEVQPPFVLLISCPYQKSRITPSEIIEYMSHNGYLTMTPSTFQDIDKSYSIPSDSFNQEDLPQKRLAQSFLRQIDYTKRPYGVDAYMFPQSQGYAILEKQWIQTNTLKWNRNKTLWKSFLHGIGGVQHLSFGWTRQSGSPWGYGVTGDSRKRHTLRGLIREGIPFDLRPNVWFYLSGGWELRRRSVNSYQQLWQSQNDSQLKSLINHDIPRTFPTHPLFSSGMYYRSKQDEDINSHEDQQKVPNMVQNTPSISQNTTQIEEEAPFTESLRRILLAISVVREDIQYCQGMNLLGGLLLIVIMEEEKAFWTLAAILQYVFPVGYFDTTLSGARVDEAIFEDIVQERYPDLYARIQNVDSKLLSLSLSWFITLFINSMPVTSVVRIWDVILMEGDKCLLRFALALLDLHKEELMKIEDDVMFAARFRQIGILQFDIDSLFTTAYRKRSVLLGESSFFPYTRKQLEQLRRDKRNVIQNVSKQCISIHVIDSDEE
ncbi:hypothetical protein WA171_003009 [Blastocystis sp. BT1]